jgi:hypothetical protein
MVSQNVGSLPGKILVALLLLATPAIALLLIAGTATRDAGPVGWLLFVVAPLALLGAGVYLIARGAWNDGSVST